MTPVRLDVLRSVLKPGLRLIGYYMRDRLDLTVEAVVVENERWHGLFTDEELARARRRLKEYRYDLRGGSASA